jgi:hypothetical protein
MQLERRSSTPFRFSDRKQLVAALGSPATAEWAADFFAGGPLPLAEIIRLSVTSNTFRAFPIARHVAPSTLYREWANSYLSEHLPIFFAAANPAGYGVAVADAAVDLTRHWSRKTGGHHELGFGRAAKMINLTIKHLVWLDGLAPSTKQRLWSLLHVPLDRFTIQGVAEFAPADLGLTRHGSMRSIVSRTQYEAVQTWLRALCSEAEVPPVHYEILAYNMRHETARQDTPGSPKVQVARIGDRHAGTASGDAPRTDSKAKPMAWREVMGARVVHAANAFYRGATFDGVFQLAEDESALEGEGGRLRCLVSWHGWRPQRGAISVLLPTGGWKLEEGYSGPVVDCLGR